MTAASGLSYTRDGTTMLVNNLNWTPGANGIKQMLYVGDTKTKVESGCPDGVGSGLGCSVKEENLSSGAGGYANLSALEPGRVYYWRVVNFQDAVCANPASAGLFVDSCLLNPSSLTLRLDDPATPLISQVYSSADITRADFSPSNANVSVNPSSDSTYTYQTAVTAAAVGTSTITGTVVLTGGVNDCNDMVNTAVPPVGPWWQAVGRDVHADGGNRKMIGKL